MERNDSSLIGSYGLTWNTHELKWCYFIAAVNDDSGGDRTMTDLGQSDIEITDSSLVGMD